MIASDFVATHLLEKEYALGCNSYMTLYGKYDIAQDYKTAILRLWKPLYKQLSCNSRNT